MTSDEQRLKDLGMLCPGCGKQLPLGEVPSGILTNPDGSFEFYCTACKCRVKKHLAEDGTWPVEKVGQVENP